MDNNYYKLLQLSEIFVNKYGYMQIVLEHYKHYLTNEVWLYNKNDKNYKVIRITLNSSNQFDFDKERYEEYLSYFNKILFNSNYKSLDIHISKDEYIVDNEKYDYVNIEEGYYAGVDLKNIYPEIYNAIHQVNDTEKEIDNIVTKMKKTIQNRTKNSSISNKTYFATYIIIALCIINYILSIFLKAKYDDTSAVLVTLGADYKIFTLFLKQYYRLITCGFVHGGLLHLFCNMYCLYSIGRYVEYKYGRTKYLIILFYSILCGSLTQGILSDNEICVGLSSGLYGLFVVYIIDMLENRMININTLLPTILINIGLNFISTTAWQAHLGGAIGGFAIYYCLKDKIKLPRIVLCVFCLLCLIYKYVTINSINNIYAGTDFNILQIYYDLGFKNYSQKILLKLNDIYLKIGGH